MLEITKITEIDNKRHIALLDTSSISFMQGLQTKGLQPETVLKDYDLILIPEWVLAEINDAVGRADYIDKADLLDMDAYKDWINKLYEEWPISDQVLSSGRIKKKNAGEVSITILAEIVSWYYPETKALTVYSEDGDTYEFQRKAEADLRNIFTSRIPVPVSYKSNDAILCQLVRDGKINLENLNDYRKDVRKITYSKEQDDYSIVLVTELVDNELFVQLVADKTVHIIF